jgi:hypothetical protein
MMSFGESLLVPACSQVDRGDPFDVEGHDHIAYGRGIKVEPIGEPGAERNSLRDTVGQPVDQF